MKTADLGHLTSLRALRQLHSLLDDATIRYPTPTMPWYSAHIVMQIRYRSGSPEPCYVMEDIVLFDAPDAKAARALAEQHGRSESNEDDLTFTCDERPAYWDYAGIRMIMECDDNERRPGSGTELTYLEYRVGSPEEVKALIAGGAVFVEFG